MNLLDSLQWDCVQFNGQESHRSIVVGEKLTKYTIGESVMANGRAGTYLASSQLGITVFDLFSEILNEKDLKLFLTSNQIDITGFKDLAALVLRAFLLLVDLNDPNYSVEPQSSMVLIEEDTEDITVTARDDLIVKQELDTCYESVQLEEFHVKVNRVKRRKTGKKAPPQTYKCKTGKCKDSDVVFQTHKEYEEHRLQVKHYHCEPCDTEFHTRKELADHQSTEACKMFICQKCGENFKSDLKHRTVYFAVSF